MIGSEHDSDARAAGAPRCRAPVAAVVATLALLASVSPARAQQSEHDQAVELFRRGVAAAREEQWVAARRAFERAYELLPRPEILINLAAAQAQTDQLVEARRGYREILGMAGVDPRLRQEAERALEELDRDIPRVRITIAGLEPGDRVTLDGAPLAREALDGDLSVDPGPHVVVVTQGDAIIARAELTAERGRTIAVPMTITDRPAVRAADGEPSSVAATSAEPTLPLVVGGILTAAGVAFGVVDLVSIGLEGSCAEGAAGGACAQVWALDEGPVIGYAVVGLASLAAGVAFLVWGATMGGPSERTPGSVSWRGGDLAVAF